MFVWVMKIRAIIFSITLLAYALSLAHSVIPHHHHKSAEEARSHEHATSHSHSHKHAHSHDHASNADHHQDEKRDKHSHESGHLFFLTHDSNLDVLVRNSLVEKSIKEKKVQKVISTSDQVISQSTPEHLVFHPPKSDGKLSLYRPSSNSLRAPPSLLA